MSHNTMPHLQLSKLLAQGARLSAGMDCWQDNLLCVPLPSSSHSPTAGAATSAMEEMATIKRTEITNRIGQLDTNNVSDRAASLDAEQHVVVPAAEVGQKLVHPGASSVIKTECHGHTGKALTTPTSLLTLRGTTGSWSCCRTRSRRKTQRRRKLLS